MFMLFQTSQNFIFEKNGTYRTGKKCLYFLEPLLFIGKTFPCIKKEINGHKWDLVFWFLYLVINTLSGTYQPLLYLIPSYENRKQILLYIMYSDDPCNTLCKYCTYWWPNKYLLLLWISTESSFILVVSDNHLRTRNR